MEHTDGLGGPAEVWVDGRLMTVCDALSEPAERCEPGMLENVEFSYMAAEGFAWDQAARGNPSRKMALEHVRRWSYVGYGQVVQVMPVVVDFGALKMTDANWSTDEGLVGTFVRVPIDRLEIAFARAPDWPEAAR